MKLLALPILFACGVAQAAPASLIAVPTDWTLESYSAQGVVLWHTGSTCHDGVLTLPDGAEPALHNRLFALITAAKLSETKVFINYDNATQHCTITSFGLA